MDALQGIKSSISREEDAMSIARKIFLSYSTQAFKDNEEKEFYIRDSISRKYEIPISSIAVSGSSKIGISVFKDRVFIPGKSDLDIAIISLPLFNKFAETANQVTSGYTNLSPFPLYKGKHTNNQFKWNFMRGYINPFFMPNCELKSKWIEFFNSLSNGYFELFKTISGAIYSSEYFFEYKQKDCIEQYLNNPDKYDKIFDTVKGIN